MGHKSPCFLGYCADGKADSWCHRMVSCKETQVLAVGSLPVCLWVVRLRGYTWDTKDLLHSLCQNPLDGPVTYGLKRLSAAQPSSPPITWWYIIVEQGQNNCSKISFQKVLERGDSYLLLISINFEVLLERHWIVPLPDSGSALWK